MRLALKNFRIAVCIMLASTIFVVGCGDNNVANIADVDTDSNEIVENGITDDNSSDYIANETGANSHIDFDKLVVQNEDIVAWLLVPGTNIDCPVMQNIEDDSYYWSHNAYKEVDETGALFMEQTSLCDMCDFNTVIHGRGGTGAFGELINFENPDFFENNRQFYVYLPDNQLTYEIAAVFERENTSLVRDFSFAEAKGDRAFIQYVINERIPGKQLCEGWEEFDEYNFFTTLTIDEPGSDKQLVVIGILVNDAAGTINREVVEEFDMGPDLLAQ